MKNQIMFQCLGRLVKFLNILVYTLKSLRNSVRENSTKKFGISLSHIFKKRSVVQRINMEKFYIKEVFPETTSFQ